MAASGVLRISRRRGKGLRGHGGLSRLIFCTCFQAPTPASPASFATAQDGRSDSPLSQSSVHASKHLRQLAQPALPRPKTAAPTRHRRGDVHLLTPVASLPAAAKAAKKVTLMQSPPPLSRQPARPQPAASSDVEPAALTSLMRPARWQEQAARRSSQRERHLEAASAAAAAVRPIAAMTRRKVRVPP